MPLPDAFLLKHFANWLLHLNLCITHLWQNTEPVAELLSIVHTDFMKSFKPTGNGQVLAFTVD